MAPGNFRKTRANFGNSTDNIEAQQFKIEWRLNNFVKWADNFIQTMIVLKIR
jgi:hypothetical protein